MPLVNIRYAGMLPDKLSQTALPNQIALYYNGDKYRYYVHVDGAKLTIVSKKLSDINPKSDNDWENHMQFSNNYTNVPCEEYTDASSTDMDTTASNGDHFDRRLTSDGDTASPVKKPNICEASSSPVNGFQKPSSATEEAKEAEP